MANISEMVLMVSVISWKCVNHRLTVNSYDQRPTIEKSLVPSLSTAVTSQRWWPQFPCRSSASSNPSSSTPTGSSLEVRRNNTWGNRFLFGRLHYVSTVGDWLLHKIKYWLVSVARPFLSVFLRNRVQRHRELRKPGPHQPQCQLQLDAVPGHGSDRSQAERPESAAAQRRHRQHDAGVL